MKRLNNIHKENEIFARITIKVPHRPFSEALAGVHQSGTSSPTEPRTSKLIDIDSLESKLDDSKENISEVNQIIFNSNIITKETRRTIDNSRYLSTQENIYHLPHRPTSDPISKLSCSGSDWDISYPALIVCIVLVIFAIPLIYVFYIAEHPELYVNRTDTNGS